MWEKCLTGFKNPQRPFPVGFKDFGEEVFGLLDEIVFQVVVSHAQVLCSAPHRDNVESVQLELDIITEFCDKLKSLRATRQIMELQDTTFSIFVVEFVNQAL